jgi:hypothetical protein
VVGDEREHAVLLGVGGLEAIQVEAVRLDHVDAVLVDVADLQVVQDEAVGAVGPDADVLGVVGRVLARGAVVAQ